MNKEDLAEHWNFPWPLMEVLIGGKSPIDLKTLRVKDEIDADRFLKSYGFDQDNHHDQRKTHAILIESLCFIQGYLIPKEWKKGNTPPEEILLCSDPRELLIWASKKGTSLIKDIKLQAWSCAVLKIMHTISHLDDLNRLNRISEARIQIMDRFKKCIFKDKQGRLWLGDEKHHIELEKVVWKPIKQRESMILKLLHKPSNVAETIFDLLGIRIVTKHLNEALVAVKYLRQFYLVDFAHIHPARSRNTLIDVKKFQAHIDALRHMLLTDNISEEGFKNSIHYLNTPASSKTSNNPHSSGQYKAIQLTCRQRIQNQYLNSNWQNKIRAFLKKNQHESSNNSMLRDFFKFTEQWYDTQKNQNVAIFFPFEVQIMDSETAKEMEIGDASHDRYKKAQIRTARKRIITQVLNLPA